MTKIQKNEVTKWNEHNDISALFIYMSIKADRVGFQSWAGVMNKVHLCWYILLKKLNAAAPELLELAINWSLDNFYEQLAHSVQIDRCSRIYSRKYSWFRLKYQVFIRTPKLWHYWCHSCQWKWLLRLPSDPVPDA